MSELKGNTQKNKHDRLLSARGAWEAARLRCPNLGRHFARGNMVLLVYLLGAASAEAGVLDAASFFVLGFVLRATSADGGTNLGLHTKELKPHKIS